MFPFVKKAFPDASTFQAYADGVKYPTWRPRFVVVHNTSAPDAAAYDGYQNATAKRPAISDEQWAANLEGYYKNDQRWSGGPHGVVTRKNVMVVLNPFNARGTHTPSWNGVSLGIETVGEFDRDPFDGAIRQNLIDALAVIHLSLGLSPLPFELGVRGLHFHKEDEATTHKDCPGKHVIKADLVAAVIARMTALAGGGHDHEDIVVDPVPIAAKPTGKTAVSGLNVRAAASGKAPSYGTLKKGTPFTVLERATNGDTVWLRVDTATLDGWIAAAMVSLDA